MNDDIYKELFKIINGCTILSCWLCNYLLMFYYPPLMILLSEIGVFVLVNILIYVVCKVGD